MINKKIIISFIFIFVILGIACFFYEIKYVDKIYPGVSIGEINIGGKTLTEAERIINRELDKIKQTGIIFRYENKDLTIYPIISSSDGAIVDILINFDVEKTLNKAILIGRGRNIINSTIEKIKLIFGKKNYITLITEINNEKINKYLIESFSLFDPQDAYYYYDKNGNLLIQPEKDGKAIKYENSLIVLKSNLEAFNFSDIILEGNDAIPQISANNCLDAKSNLEDILNLAPVKLKYLKRKWTINEKDLLGMITISEENNNLFFNLDETKIKEYIRKNISPEIDQVSSLPKFIFIDNVIQNFEPGKEGKKLDVDSTVKLLINLIENPFNEAELTVNILPFPEDVNEDVSDYGIKEIIGKYSLGFEGSTVARTLNIKNGSKSLNGLLLKPGEEFSMIEALGDIDEEHGYEKEAVIKGDAIYYEFGGGLCHTSTTLFRAVLDSGLPITMRQNHSYNMPYYQPAGIDATIYNPSPDFRFVNDTENYILIQSEVVDSELYIELWGAKDGRIIERTEPVIYNIVKPLATKYIKTSTLISGDVKCTYMPYDGADTYFDYIVTYSDGTIKNKRFKSHYIPRQGVCLVGA
ncbi:MAG: VanW family protein [Candidatus Pacebacteria bacterium]|nr:VanW family protein [Candidatus Paceibacterota bacterium]MDD4074307.1 VanW family protein [Candidatus Paceibacterota bacterium]